MKDKETTFTVNGKEYRAIFNLNVMQSIQNEYETFAKWGELTDGYVYDDDGDRVIKKDADGNELYQEIDGKKMPVYEKKEVNIKALIFGIKEMLNEAIDIDNESAELRQEFLTTKQVGRLITAMGIENATKKLNQTVINSVQSDNQKNV